MNYEKYIRRTYELARQAARIGGDPFGAVLVKDDRIIAESSDTSVLLSDPTHHAELGLISDYCRKEKIISLDGYTLFSSTEPCVMCSGAIHWAKISSVVFGVYQSSLQKYSGGKNKPTANEMINTGNKQVEVIGGILESEGMKIFEEFPIIPKSERHKILFKK